MLPDNKTYVCLGCFSFEQGRKQLRSCFSEPELPADLLFEDSVEDWQLISGHVVQPDYIDFKKSESGFAYGLVSQLRAGSYEPKPSLEIVNCVSIVVYV